MAGRFLLFLGFFLKERIKSRKDFINPKIKVRNVDSQLYEMIKRFQNKIEHHRHLIHGILKSL